MVQWFFPIKEESYKKAEGSDFLQIKANHIKVMKSSVKEIKNMMTAEQPMMMEVTVPDQRNLKRKNKILKCKSLYHYYFYGKNSIQKV